MAYIDHLLNPSADCNLFVPADRWQAAVREVQTLVESLTSR
jgi:hypothetical protein